MCSPSMLALTLSTFLHKAFIHHAQGMHSLYNCLLVHCFRTHKLHCQHCTSNSWPLQKGDVCWNMSGIHANTSVVSTNKWCVSLHPGAHPPEHIPSHNQGRQEALRCPIRISASIQSLSCGRSHLTKNPGIGGEIRHKTMMRMSTTRHPKLDQGKN